MRLLSCVALCCMYVVCDGIVEFPLGWKLQSRHLLSFCTFSVISVLFARSPAIFLILRPSGAGNCSDVADSFCWLSLALGVDPLCLFSHVPRHF